MANFISFNRKQVLASSPEWQDWLCQDDLAPFVIDAVEQVPLAAFATADRRSGKPAFHPRLMLALLIDCYAHGIFSSRRIERASERDLGVRFVAAGLHPDHDTIATFGRSNATAFETAFQQGLRLARDNGRLQVGTVSIDGTKIDANASKIHSVRYDRAGALERDRLRLIQAQT